MLAFTALKILRLRYRIAIWLSLNLSPASRRRISLQNKQRRVQATVSRVNVQHASDESFDLLGDNFSFTHIGLTCEQPNLFTFGVCRLNTLAHSGLVVLHSRTPRTRATAQLVSSAEKG
jgi:hypothetical protein